MILAPFNFGFVHWALFLIDPDAGIIYYLDPMATDPTRHLNLSNTTDCGYFVMRFMKEIVMQYPKKIPEKGVLENMTDAGFGLENG
ncbi:hypothetical protein P8452_14496 [Trifolium repens]|nr:hypothetical protein P8452_14496 [Trifolium repens]